MHSIWDRAPFRPGSANAVDKAWRDGLLILDANVLLNLYRVPLATRNDVLEVLEACAERLWLPHQAACEYFKNRPAVIEEQFDMFLKMKRTVEEGCAGPKSCAVGSPC